MSKYLKSLFDFMKDKGLLKEFNTYEEYQELKFGKETFEEWKEKLPEKEKKQFNFIFKDR